MIDVTIRSIPQMSFQYEFRKKIEDCEAIFQVTRLRGYEVARNTRVFLTGPGMNNTRFIVLFTVHSVDLILYL